MSPVARKNLTFLAGVILLVALCIVFPSVLKFVEIAAREIRFLWWEIAILSLGVWLAFFFGKKSG
jgi:hypothetical protein